MNTETHPEHGTTDTLPRFTLPPPPRADLPASRMPRLWLRLSALVAVAWLVARMAEGMLHAQPTTQFTRLADAMVRMPELRWLPVVLVIVAAMTSASVGLREPQHQARSLLPLLGLTALPLLLALFLGVWG